MHRRRTIQSKLTRRRVQKLRLRFEFVNISQTKNGNNVRYYFSYDDIPMIVYY